MTDIILYLILLLILFVALFIDNILIEEEDNNEIHIQRKK